MASTKFLVIMEALFYVKSFCVCNVKETDAANYEGWNFNSGNYLFTTDTK